MAIYRLRHEAIVFDFVTTYARNRRKYICAAYTLSIFNNGLCYINNKILLKIKTQRLKNKLKRLKDITNEHISN